MQRHNQQRMIDSQQSKGIGCVIGITGGVATGKSTLVEFLREIHPAAKVFNADAAARALTDHDPEVKEALRREFGPEIFSGTGDLNRAALRAIVFDNADQKIALEHILHPRIRRQWSLAADDARKSGDLFLADIPLLYETGGEILCDRVVVVACSREIQRQRLLARTGIDPAEAEQMINSQMPLTKKIDRAGHVIWNNGDHAVLRAQAKILAGILNS